MEQTVLKTEQTQSRDEVAAYLRRIADKLQEGEPITVQGGGESASLDIPDRLEFEVKVEEETASGEMSLELELEWGESQTDDEGGLEIS